ncbi:MAG: dual specificity protein phosphatase family protein [Planctomycetaceae bacterium]
MSNHAPATSNASTASETTPSTRPTSRRRFLYAWIGLVACLAIIGGGIGAWEAVKYRYIPKRFGVVVPGEVYRSGQISKWQFVPTIQENGIDVVIDLNGVDPVDEHQAAEIAAYESHDIENYRFKLHGNGTGDVDTYVEAIAKMAECHRDGKSFLVHCHAGTQRTGSVVAAFRVLVLGQSPQEAYVELSRYGWDADDDQVLLTYLNKNLPRVAKELAARGLIEQVPEPFPVVEP